MSVFLKAAGGKRQLLPELRKHVPPRFGRYFEPFVGGGALFFDLVENGFDGLAFLNDANVYLASAYTVVRDDLPRLIKLLKELAGHYERGGEKFYYRLRDEIVPLVAMPSWAVRNRVAARFLFVNRTGFNGLWRVNRSGKFNVPHGKYANPTICNVDVLTAASKALKHATIGWGDFAPHALQARRGDFVYFDPPYWPVSETADFTGYTAGGFGSADQERLRDVALRLKKAGAHVLLSNADVPAVRKLYAKGFEMRRVEARRAINSKATKRGAVGELLIW